MKAIKAGPRWHATTVFLASLMVLGLTAGRPGIATAYVDPVSHIRTPDEAMYGATSFEMAAHGDWMTPRFLGRLALYKPPLYYWLSAACVKLFGATPFALRSPSILAGAATVTVVFWWVRAASGMMAGLTGALLLLSSHMFFILSRTGLMDALLTLETAVAMFTLARDSRLASTRAFWIFSVASGAAILTKGTAGFFPLLALAVFCGISRERPSFWRIAQAAGVTIAIAAPWHLWQLHLHPRWFWAEYVLTEQVVFGLGSPPQSVQEPQLWFYAKRLLALDPLLIIATLVAFTRTRPKAVLAWMAVVTFAVLVFAYHSASYLMPLFPAMAIVVGSAIPPRDARWALAVAVVICGAKVVSGDPVRGISFRPESEIPSQMALSGYAALHRGKTLILVEPDDEFYSSDLALPQVRYVYIDPSHTRPHYPLDFEHLGIVMTAADFAHLERERPMYRARLHEWNLDSDQALATTILAHDAEEIVALVVAHPEDDFYAPWAYAVDDQIHIIAPGAHGRVFLLAREAAH